MKYIKSLLPVIILVVTKTLDAGEISASLLERVNKKAAMAWRHCQERLNGHEVIVTKSDHTTWLDKAGKQKEWKRRYSTRFVKRDDSLLMVDLVDDRPNPLSILRSVKNERYSFELSRDNRDKSFGLTELSTNKEQVLSYLGIHTDLVFSGTISYAMPLSEYFTHSFIRMTECSERVDAVDGPLVVMSFEIQDVPSTFRLVTNGELHTLELMPEKDWQLRRATIIGPKGADDHKVQVDIQYELSSTLGWIPRRHVLVRGNDESRDVITTDISVPVLTTTKAEEFYLPHYGISESIVETPAWGRGTRILMFAGGAALLVGAFVMFRRLDRRRKAA